MPIRRRSICFDRLFTICTEYFRYAKIMLCFIFVVHFRFDAVCNVTVFVRYLRHLGATDELFASPAKKCQHTTVCVYPLVYISKHHYYSDKLINNFSGVTAPIPDLCHSSLNLCQKEPFLANILKKLIYEIANRTC